MTWFIVGAAWVAFIGLVFLWFAGADERRYL